MAKRLAVHDVGKLDGATLCLEDYDPYNPNGTVTCTILAIFQDDRTAEARRLNMALQARRDLAAELGAATEASQEDRDADQAFRDAAEAQWERDTMRDPRA